MYRLLISVLVFLLLTACQDTLDVGLLKKINQYQLTGNPIDPRYHTVSDIASPEAQLGKLLFFSKALSGDRTVACASCHHPFRR